MEGSRESLKSSGVYPEAEAEKHIRRLRAQGHTVISEPTDGGVRVSIDEKAPLRKPQNDFA